MASPFGGYYSKWRRDARRGKWHPEFLGAYGPHGVRRPDVTPRCKRELMRAIGYGCYLTSTTGGVHAPGSWHYRTALYKSSSGVWRRGGRAIDVAGSRVAMARYYNDCRRRSRKGGTQFYELFGPGWWHAFNDVIRSGQFPGHTTHVHVVPTAIY